MSSNKKKLLLIIPFLLAFAQSAKAQIEWDEPKIVNRNLSRKDRVVLRFSGYTEPTTWIRIRNNRIQFRTKKGRMRSAKIPRKNALQFPVMTDENGAFSFDLYLPITFVDIPIEIRKEKRKPWELTSLKFQVPDKNSLSHLKSIEESFSEDTEANEDAENIIADIEGDQRDSSSWETDGMEVKSRNQRDPKKQKNLRLWGGVGSSFFLTSVASTEGDYEGSGSEFIIPSLHFGLDWDFSNEFIMRANYFKGSGTIGNLSLERENKKVSDFSSKNFNWDELQLSFAWFPDFFRIFKSENFAFDFGFVYQSLPFFRQSCTSDDNDETFCRFSFFDSTVYNLHFGLFYRNKLKNWNYEVYGRYLYPFSSEGFSFETVLPFNYELGGSLRIPVNKTLSLGVFGQFRFFGADVKYNFNDVSSGNITGNSTNILSSLDLFLINAGVRLIMDF